jgi:hypothetical protein
MSDKNFKVKNGLTIEGTVNTVLTADNAGGILVNGSPNTGPQGTTGAQGATGAQGTAGTQGTQGTQGGFAFSLGTGVQGFLTTPSSANLATALTDETGSGALVFATSPTLVTPTLGTATATKITSPLYASLDSSSYEQDITLMNIMGAW